MHSSKQLFRSTLNLLAFAIKRALVKTESFEVQRLDFVRTNGQILNRLLPKEDFFHLGTIELAHERRFDIDRRLLNSPLL